MNRSRRRLWLVVVIQSATLTGAARADDATKEVGTLAGRVIDLDGQPVAGAEVWTGDRDQAAARTKTGVDGRFQLGPVSDERGTTLWAEHVGRGLAREHFDDVRVFAGRETDLGDLTLADGARLSGRIVGSDGQPVAGAEGRIVSWRHVMGHTITQNGPKWDARGDDDGRFRTPALPVGSIDFTITAPHKARRSLSQVVEPGRSTIDLGLVRLDDERPITGTVVGQDGLPVAGARVVVDADHDHPAHTDDQGRFAVPDAAIDAQWLLVEARGYFDPSLKPVHELKGARADIKLALQKAFTVEGSVVDAESGAPIDFEQVQLCTVERDDDANVTLVG